MALLSILYSYMNRFEPQGDLESMRPSLPRTCWSVARLSLALLAAACAGHRPIVIAHRGASCYRPEHTLAAYALAIDMGADFIEPDLVSTKDGVLVARHENEIGGTTDVATKFPDRRTTKVIDGSPVTGWFSEDLTIAELRTLRARERTAARSHAYDGLFGIPTFDEVLALADSAGRRRGREVGVYPETKHPTYFRGIGLPLESGLLAALRARGLDRRDAPVFIQSFEDANLRALRAATRVRLVQLIHDASQVTPQGLRKIASYADGIGANTRLVVPASAEARPSSLVRDAHAAGLFVHVWTLRPEPGSLAARYDGDPLAEVRELAALGVDGMFGDCPDQILTGLRRGK
jgi:glycerophosphoryl diester phosphodiesterase